LASIHCRPDEAGRDRQQLYLHERSWPKSLNYTGDTSDSASMNIWLHKEVIKKLAANGGKVPADLLD
jgi:hypothetical protein